MMFIEHFGKDKILEMKIRRAGGVGSVINTSATRAILVVVNTHTSTREKIT